MKRYLSTGLFVLLILVFLSACKNENSNHTSTYYDYFSEIMTSSGKYPQLTKDEFLNITQNYLETGKWDLPFEKACFYTHGVNYSAYIVENEFLFSLYVNNISDNSKEDDICLLYYVNGVATEYENDPLLFENFLK